MAQVIIEHPDGRRYEVSEKAFTDLYEPFGFKVQGVVFNGALLADSEENRARANEAYGSDPNQTPLVQENAARAVILSDLEAEARAKQAAETSPSAGTVGSGEMITPENPPKTGKASKSGEAGNEA